MTKLTQEHLRRFELDGFLVVEDWFLESTRLQILEAMHAWVPPRPIPENSFAGASFPYPQQIFNEVIVKDPDLLNFISMALGSDDLHLRLAHNWARFPGNDPLPAELETEVLQYGGDKASDSLAAPMQRVKRSRTKQRFPGFHIDNGNNSLVPPTHDRRLGQISCWYFPEAVDESMAPMLVVPKGVAASAPPTSGAGSGQLQPDRSKAIALTVPAGTLMIFSTVLWHNSSMFQGQEGQRYTLTRIFGRADHPW
jgi:hypothetical protein